MVLCALAVVAGAFGAHALKARLDPAALELWEVAARYLFYGGVGVVLVGFGGAILPGAHGALAPLALTVGTLIFAGTVGALALGGPRILGAVTPLGGSLMIGGFLLFAWRLLRG
jgi:uncharacterized membrane protein YgdD (TMEM256/DUF423 family)